MRASLLVVFATACGFPNVAFVPADGSATDASIGDVAIDVAIEHVDPPLPDGGDSGKPPLGDSGKPCDQDNDTFIADTCSGTDCDDTDDRARPDITTFRYWTATPQTKGDWNCNHTIETEISVVDLKCSDYPYGSNCAALAGFDSNPPCGYFGNYVTCKSGGLLAPCTVATSAMKQQGCK